MKKLSSEAKKDTVRDCWTCGKPLDECEVYGPYLSGEVSRRVLGLRPPAHPEEGGP